MAPLDILRREVTEVVVALSALDILLFLATVATLRMLFYRLLQPIREIQTGVAQIGAGALDHRFQMRSGDELEALAESFNHMAT
jgi:nitrate/nitrite-specific signal transduction histidine kinase